jgi:hypothetical protein
MATLAGLCGDDGPLFKLDPVLDSYDADAQEERLIYASKKFRDWIVKVLPGLGSTWNVEELPDQQVDALFEDFTSGIVLTYSHQFKCLNPVGDGVWELKTADVRIFGWFYAMDCFIAIVADTKQHILDHGLYAGYRGEVVHYRNQLALDEPKFIDGDDPNVVVSNYTIPQ